MEPVRSRQVIIAGAGVAGLTAALAFAARGYSVHVYERSAELTEVGAGLQLSPNATRILTRYGVLGLLDAAAVRPEAIVLKDAASLNELARVPLGAAAEDRWDAPYIVAHRADVQAALLAAVRREAEIRLTLSASVRDFAVHGQGVTVSVDIEGEIRDVRGLLLVGADGVWSSLRGLSGGKGESAFSGQIAWRRTLRAHDDSVATLLAARCVTAFLHPRFHLVAYPIRAGGAVNLAAFTRGEALPPGWQDQGDPAPLREAMTEAAQELRALAAGDLGWTRWPIHVAPARHPWVAGGGLALIGDAAHALTPFAAQGAAMAIEDAETLAESVAGAGDDMEGALAQWEAERRPRIRRVQRRGAFNALTWHASGPVAAVRDRVLKLRPARRLAADMDWLYGYGRRKRHG